MKKLIFVILILLTFALNVEARGLMMVGGGVTAAGGEPTCSSSATVSLDDDDDNWKAAQANNNAIVGQGDWAPASNSTICKIGFNIDSMSGAARTWYAIVFPMSGTSLGSPAAGCISTGTSVTGGGWFYFEGLDCDVVTTSTYGVTLSRSSTGNTSADCITDNLCDVTNNLSYRVSTNTSAVVGNTMEWFLDDKTRVSNRTSNETNIKIYNME